MLPGVLFVVVCVASWEWVRLVGVTQTEFASLGVIGSVALPTLVWVHQGLRPDLLLAAAWVVF